MGSSKVLTGAGRLSVLMAVSLTAMVAATSSKIAPDMPATGTARVIVQYAASPSNSQLAGIPLLGGLLNEVLGIVNAVVCTLPVQQLSTLIADPNVIYISPDRGVHGLLEYANPTVNANIALAHGFNGNGVGIALIDSGINDHPDLHSQGLLGALGLSRVVYSQSFVGGTGTGDGFGHGTHVAGILAGDAKDSSSPADTHTFRGIAPNAVIVNLKALDDNGNGNDSTVIAAIQQAVLLKSLLNIRVMNLSLGRPVMESYQLDPLCKAVEYAWKNGITVVAAAGNYGRDNSAGNNGYGTITAPGDDPYVITVGAMKDMSTVIRSDDRIASYSSKGPTAIDHIVKPDIVAPGNLIVSLAQPATALYGETASMGLLVPFSYYEPAVAGYSTQYFRLSGTSMAAPMVSGAAALLLQQDSSLTPDQIKARLMLTATKTFPAYSIATDPITGIGYTSQYDIFTVGAGYLDVWAALNSTARGTGSALSPTAVYDFGTQTAALVPPAGSMWASSPDWSTFTVWGSNVVDNGSFTVWGSSGDASTFTVWGSGSPVVGEQ